MRRRVARREHARLQPQPLVSRAKVGWYLPAIILWSSVTVWLLIAGRESGASPPAWLGDFAPAARWLAAIALVGGTLAAAWIYAAPPTFRRRIPRLAITAAPLTLWLIVLAGGTGSSAILLLVPLTAVLSLRYRDAVTGLCAIAGVGLVLVADWLLGRALAIPEALIAGTTVGALAVAPGWYRRRVVRDAGDAQQRLARVEGYLADRRHTPRSTTTVARELRPAVQEIQRAAEGLRHLTELDRYLRDVRDVMGADEVVFWRWNEARSTQIPVAWSTEESTVPLYFEWKEWAPLVKWTAEAGVIQCLEGEQVPYFVAAPVENRSRLLGVLSVSSRSGLTMSRNGAREWIARYASQAALVIDLLEIRRDYRRDVRQTRALLQASKALHEIRSPQMLGREICRTALDVTDAARAALIRWDDRTGTGVVQGTSEAHPVAESSPITSESCIAIQCRLGEPLLIDDARARARRGALYATDEVKRDLRSLAIVPLRRPQGVVGALIVEGDRDGDLPAGALENLALLAAIAAASLDNAWELEQSDRQARTDQLTGLSNRRHFDEALRAAMAESKRYGHPVSLIVADIDFFKRVNDQYGHQAGDSVLRAIAQVFQEKVRTTDLCARFGGEELAILLPHTSLDGALELAERLRQGVAARQLSHQGRAIPVTASFGVAEFPVCGPTHEALFAAADRALYRAKAEGRNCVRSASLSSWWNGRSPAQAQSLHGLT